VTTRHDYPLRESDRVGTTALGATVRRRDFVYRSTIVLRCEKCGTTTFGVAIEDAAFYEAAMLEHVCGLEPGQYREALATRPNLTAWLRKVGGLVPDGD
jgi:hypothetical protein